MWRPKATVGESKKFGDHFQLSSTKVAKAVLLGFFVGLVISDVHKIGSFFTSNFTPSLQAGALYDSGKADNGVGNMHGCAQ